MSKYNFEGDVDNVTDRQLDFINSVILEHGFKDSKVFFEPVGKAGDNYVANVKRITVDGPDGTFKMVAKLAPTIEALRLSMNTGLVFKNEHIMYTEVLPKLVQLQKDADIPEREHFRYAKCYGSLSEEPNEVILLEDLKMSDFTMLDRFSPLSNECVKSVLKNFAVLHSLSFVLKHKEPETYNHFKTSLTDIMGLMSQMEHSKMFFQTLEDDTLTMLEDPAHIDFLRHKVANIIKLVVKLHKIDANSKYTVIQQGDAWTNNIMFRFEGDTVTDSINIDYQLSKNSSPVGDLLYMIFNCTDYESRKKNFHDWIDYYHSELEKSLSNYDLKANFVYPRDRLDSDLKLYSKFFLGLCIMISSLLIRKTDDAVKVKEAMNSDNMFEQTQEFLVSYLDEDTKTLFRNKVIGLIESYKDLGL